jgi:hypothetical protein
MLPATIAGPSHGGTAVLNSGMGKTVRFTEVVEAAGTPEIYLPLANPKEDRNFMRAVKDQRVLSLKQEPTGTKKDFGTVGFVREKFISYLIFPKSLARFEGQRVVGIKYDTLREADLSAPRSSTSRRGRSTKPKPPSPKPKPRPKRFTATVRITETNDVTVTVEAWNEKEARTKAEREAHEHTTPSHARTKTELLRVKELA